MGARPGSTSYNAVKLIQRFLNRGTRDVVVLVIAKSIETSSCRTCESVEKTADFILGI